MKWLQLAQAWGRAAAIDLGVPDRHFEGRRSREDDRHYELPDHSPYLQHFAGYVGVAGSLANAMTGRS